MYKKLDDAGDFEDCRVILTEWWHVMLELLSVIMVKIIADT